MTVALAWATYQSGRLLRSVPVRENLLFALQAKQGMFRPLAPAEQRRICEHYIANLRIKTASAETPTTLNEPT